MLQQEKPSDYCIATGQQHSVRDFINLTAKNLDIPISWKGKGIDEVGINDLTGKEIVKIDQRYFWPSEVDTLLGDSEKALKGANGHKILPQPISYWKIPSDKLLENISENRLGIIKAYNNLMIVYDEALLLDPYNLAKAISSLDCWAEQEEESWQTWDIKKCRDDYLNAIHALYNVITKNQNDNIKKTNSDLKKNNLSESNVSASIVTQNSNEDILQIIYFDFDKANLSNVSIKKIENFINLNKTIITNYLIVGHTDTKGEKDYNLNLSIQRALAVKNILIKLGVQKENIKILGKGENDLNIKTEDEVQHPANRRAEISPLN